jgi:hypothetical protein
MVVALKARKRSTFKALRYVATGVLVVAALIAARHGWLIYISMDAQWDGPCAGRKRCTTDLGADR